MLASNQATRLEIKELYEIQLFIVVNSKMPWRNCRRSCRQSCSHK